MNTTETVRDYLPLDSIQLWKDNPHEGDIEAICRSIRQFGFNEVVKMKLERADARLTWDLLAEDGEDMAKIVEGAKAYREWIEVRKARKYVAMMTTWLNQRRWEESYAIDPGSEEGKLIQAEKEAETRERRSAHQAKFTPEYEAYVASLAEAGIAAPGFVDAWRAEVEATLEKHQRMGLAGAVKMAEKLLEDPEAAREDQLSRWREKNVVPSFWEWDASTNSEAWK